MTAPVLGIPALDARLGPIAQGAHILLRNDPEVDAQIFLSHVARAHLRAGHTVVFLTGTHSPARIERRLRELEVTDEELENLQIIDAYSALSGHHDGARYLVDDPTSWAAHVSRIHQAAREFPGAVLLISNLDAIGQRCSSEDNLLGPWLESLTPFHLTVAAATHWPDAPQVWAGSFDAVVGLRGIEERVVLHQVFAVERTPWHEYTDAMPYQAAVPEGVRAYIPKIVVIGPHNAGKTTLVHSVGEHATSVERLGTTVAVDRATAHIGGCVAEVFGTPGQPRFDALLPALTRQCTAAILVVDATKPDTFARAQELLHMVWKQGMIAVIALNKADLAAAVSPEALENVLAVPPGVSILSCIATEPKSARKVVGHLLAQIIGGSA